MKLYLGAGLKRLPGYTHVDLVAGPGIDVAHDLNRLPWPWPDDAADMIVAEDVVEHLTMNLVDFCDEAWRGARAVLSTRRTAPTYTRNRFTTLIPQRTGDRPTRTTQRGSGEFCSKVCADHRISTSC